jgi:uracil-DNA glycosylase
VPPENKPTTVEINTCRRFLSAGIAARKNLKAIVALGRIAHDTTLRALGERPSRFPFGHNASHNVGGLHLTDSYHCSRYNTNTGVLTTEMFEAVFANVRDYLALIEAARP